MFGINVVYWLVWPSNAEAITVILCQLYQISADLFRIYVVAGSLYTL